MNKGKLIVANWKMNFHYKNADNFCKKILSKKKLIKNKFVICPPTTLILQLTSKFKKITFGAQNCHYEKFGAFTGDISAVMLKDINCKYVIVGHSERRSHHFEDSIILKKKMECVLNAGLIPIYCIGEDISIKDLAALIKETIGFQGQLYFNADKPDGTMKKLTDVSKLNALGWRHEVALPQGIERMYNWYTQS